MNLDKSNRWAQGKKDRLDRVVGQRNCLSRLRPDNVYSKLVKLVTD
jgi:hypothetical protein